jgi:hypothetical protein
VARRGGRLGSWCKTCCADWGREYRRTEVARKGDRAKRLRKLGVSVVVYDELSRRQNGVCAVCGNPESGRHYRSRAVIRLAVDHSHLTGKVRGLLCRACNVGLGRFCDNPVVLRQAAEYVEAHEK